MTLTDLLKPDETETTDDMTLRKLVRQKSFKTMVRALSKKNNPGDGSRNTVDVVGDGGRDDSPAGTETTDLL